MKTVQDYLDLGLVFVGGDKICGVTGDQSSSEMDIFDRTICARRYSKGAAKIGVDYYARARWTPSSFAWRNNDGVKPEYKGVIDAVTVSKHEYKGFSSESELFEFEDDRSDDYIIKWRPVVLQSDDAKGNKDSSFKLPIGIDSPELRWEFKSLKEHFENKPPFWNKSVPSFSCPCVAVNIKAVKPTVSPKEYKPMKPVYTAEMHAKGELPSIGADCILIIDSEPRQARVTYIGKSLGVCSNIDGGAEYAFLLGEASFKPIIKTIKVNGFDVPAPMSEAPECGSEYFVIDMLDECLFCSVEWEGDGKDNQWLSNGICHSTESAAIAHAKAMLGINPNPARGGDGHDRNVLGQNNEGDEI